VNQEVNCLSTLTTIGFLCLPFSVAAQEADSPSQPADERWSIHFQATSIGQHHGGFPSLYEGQNSLPPHPENRVSLTATVFLALRLGWHTDLVINPEIAGGRGFGEVTGIAGFTNGEIPRVASATPTPYPARVFLRTVWSLGRKTESVANGLNQPAGTQPVSRFTLIAGKFAATDYFDNNRYSHDPRKQFMNWSLMSNGAWDYPADTRGYTVGFVEELALRNWSLRLAQLAEPAVANGSRLDTRISRNRADTLEWEGRYSFGGRQGTLRVLGYANREHAGTFREAMRPGRPPDLAPTRRNGTLKYGFGLNLEQALTPEIGVFSRYGWSDGKTESWAFTQIDRSVSGGLAIQGKRWKRAGDCLGVAGVRNYLSGDQSSFLAAGGLGFIIGDGRLDHYRPESILEAYYSWQATKQFTFTVDYQRVDNPAYNHDRGPVSVLTLRVHWEK
jgi:high affinity Mn2+ porin